jgi:serine/threonine-protein kinase
MEPVNILTLDPIDSLPKASIGGFRLARELATGGMATVYLGHRSLPGNKPQVAAVKVMFPHLAEDAEHVEMFFDEARLTAAIEHPYVCGVLGHGVEAGLHYLATEYVLGETWADLVDALHRSPEGKALAPSLLAHVAAQACEGLHAVHEARDAHGKHLAIVHRDMSPPNLMLGYDGAVRLLDFGIATAAERLHETRNGVLKGHVAYMAPEQARGAAVDRRCDIWSLGVMLWEGVSGRRLFKRAHSRATLDAVAYDPLESLLSAAPEIPPALMAIIRRAVVRDPRQRFATAREFGIALSSLSLGAHALSTNELTRWMARTFSERLASKQAVLESALEQAADNTGVSRSTIRPAGSSTRPSGMRAAVRGGPAANGPLSAAEPPQRSDELAWAAKPTRRWRKHLTLGLCALVAATAAMVSQLPSKNSAPALPDAPKTATRAMPSPTARPTAPAADGVGVVEVRAQGKPVRVALSGKDLGVTPLTLELAPGLHILRVTTLKGNTWVDTPVHVEAGERYAMQVTAQPSRKTAKR